MYQMTMRKQCDSVKGVTYNDEPTENYHINLQLPSAFHTKPTVHYLLSSKWQTDS